MNLNNLNPVLAQAAAGNQVDPNALVKMLGFYAIIGVGCYVVLIRPQQKRAKQQAEMVKAIKAGDKVVTNSGVIGVVVGVKENSLTIRSADAKLEFLKSAVTEVTERAGEVTTA